jgi:hypothetical protein
MEFVVAFEADLVNLGPIQQRGDVLALTSSWDEHGNLSDLNTVVTWVREWASRDHLYMPYWQRQWLTSERVLSWGESLLMPLAAALRECVLVRGDSDQLQAAYAEAKTLAFKLQGVGKLYGCEHLLRTWFLVWDISHPSPNFVVMGGGASKAKFSRLEAMGLGSVESIRSLLPGREVDAGVIAFILCMGGACNAVLQAHTH